MGVDRSGRRHQERPRALIGSEREAPAQGALDLGPGLEPGSSTAVLAARSAGHDDATTRPPGRVVRVVPDVGGISRRFDYVVPERFDEVVEVGTIVRVDLHGRRVAAWVVEVDVEVEADAGYQLKAIARVTGRGPSAEMVSLAEWAAWRWAGRLRVFLRAASPPGRVPVVASAAASPRGEVGSSPSVDGLRSVVDGSKASERDSLPIRWREPVDSLSIRRVDSVESLSNHRPTGASGVTEGVDATASALSVSEEARRVLRLAPAADRYPVVTYAAEATPDEGALLVLCPSVAQARQLASRLRRDRAVTRSVACVAHDKPSAAATAEWMRAAEAGIVVGARAAAFAPVSRLGTVVVLDEHDEAYQEESSPTWHARDVVIERARRSGAPVTLVSPTPTLEALEWGTLREPSRGEERRGWPLVEIIDRREEDPAAGLLTEPLAALLRQGGRVVCVVNRKGRSRLSACGSCRELLTCASCDGPVTQPDDTHLVCTRCGTERPMVCTHCGATRFRVLRPGVARLRDELAALIGEPVDEITGARDADHPLQARVVVGTEAALHRVDRADAVAFLDIDQELMAPRERAREHTLALLARAARLVRGRSEHGRILVQTRHPDDVVLQAALHADPGRVAEADRLVRQAMGLAPYQAVAEVGGPAAAAYIEALGRPEGLTVFGGAGEWRIKAPDHQTLCDALADVERPPGRLRLVVDPRRS